MTPAGGAIRVRKTFRLRQTKTDSLALIRLARRMENYPATYARGCQNGHDAVFAVQHEEQLAGAIRISRRNACSPRRPGQTEGAGTNYRERHHIERRLARWPTGPSRNRRTPGTEKPRHDTTARRNQGRSH